MEKRWFFTLFIAFVTMTSMILIVPGNKNVTGEWKYDVPAAPYGYQKGAIIITEKENKLDGEVKFADGYQIKLRNLSLKSDTLRFGLYIENEYISVWAKIEGLKMIGNVNSSEGLMNFSAEKNEKKPE